MAKQPKNKQTVRSGNVRLLRPAAPPFDPMESSDSLENLIANARVSMQHAVNAAEKFSDEEIANTVLVVLDGTSPIAPIEMRKHGKKMFGSNLVPRKILIDSIEKAEPVAAGRLAVIPECGHLQYFVSTLLGGDIRCTRCDLGMKPGDVVSGMDGNSTPPMAS